MEQRKNTADNGNGAMTTGMIMKELNRISRKSAPVTPTSRRVVDGHEKIVVEETPKQLRYPWYIVFILGNELCERFAFYGMKAVLTLYFLEAFLWSESTATLVYHVFLVFSYFTPIFGAMLADGYLGKFATIFSLSVVYIAGLILMTLASIPPIGLHPVAGFVSGLLLVAVGTGGIKPCVSAYGGDQFQEGQERHRERFFSIFYFCINAGSLVSTFVTPILRSDLPCLGKDGCYPAAFGLPAGLLAIAIAFFVFGRPFYRNIPPSGNILGKVVMCIWHALSNKYKNKGPKNSSHWLDYASDKYSKDFIKDVKQIMPVLKMFLPLPIFWTLFDQKGSRWTLQANKMDGRITDSFYWKPDQVQIFNPVLILILVPIFETVIFPLIKKCGWNFRLLARMVVGMLLAGVAFVIAGLLQMELNSYNPVITEPAELRIFNTIPGCTINFQTTFENTTVPVLSYQMANITLPKENLFLMGNETTVSISVWMEAGKCNKTVQAGRLNFPIKKMGVHSVFISEQSGSFRAKLIDEIKEKPRKGAGFVRFIAPFRFNTRSGGGIVTLINKDATEGKSGYQYLVDFDRNLALFPVATGLANATVVADQGNYDVYLPDETSPNGRRLFGSTRMNIPNGGVYTIIFTEDESPAPWITHHILPPSSVNVFLQLPQYFVITLAEVLFSVSGVAFAYSQAPSSMKAVIQAAWLLTTAFGNVIVIIISGAQLFEDPATEFFVFAGIIAVFAVLFAIMTRFYTYVEIVGTNSKDAEITKEEIEESVDN